LLLAIALAIPSTIAVSQPTSVVDSQIESCLATGKILKGQAPMQGVTRPIKIQVRCNGETRSALFKSIDEHRRGVTRLQGASPEMNFSDDFRYERAAYLLDRALGLDMVPVAVLRSRRGDDGALVDWVENASHQSEMPREPTSQEMIYLGRQKKLMRLFDALIANTDRRPPNWLIGDEDWKLYLIDHSRAFRTDKELTQDYVEDRAWLSRDLYQRLEDLDEGDLKRLLKDLVDGRQIRAIMVRRDAIIAKIDRDRGEFGDEIVFSD
jgi:hypothetical protein